MNEGFDIDVIIAALRNPENNELLSLHKALLDVGNTQQNVTVVAWLNDDQTLSPLAIIPEGDILKHIEFLEE